MANFRFINDTTITFTSYTNNTDQSAYTTGALATGGNWSIYSVGSTNYTNTNIGNNLTSSNDWDEGVQVRVRSSDFNADRTLFINGSSSTGDTIHQLYFVDTSNYAIAEVTQAAHEGGSTDMITFDVDRWLVTVGNPPADSTEVRIFARVNGTYPDLINDESTFQLNFDGAFRGTQGRANSTSLSSNILTATKVTTGDDAFSTDGDLYAIKRIFSLYNSSGDHRGIAWISGELTSSTWALDPVLDANGSTCYFIDHQGNAVTPASTDYVKLSGSFQDVDAIPDVWTKAQTAGVKLLTEIDFGDLSATASHDDTVLYTESVQMSGEGLNNKNQAYFTMGGGQFVFGRLLDYSTNTTRAGCSFDVNGDVGRRFRAHQTPNPSSGYTTSLYWFGGFAGGSRTQDYTDGTADSALPTMNSATLGNEFYRVLFMNIESKSPLGSGDIGSPPVADTDGNGGFDDVILRGSFINYGGTFAGWQWYGTSAGNILQVGATLNPSTGSRAFCAHNFNAPANDTFDIGSATALTTFEGRTNGTGTRKTNERFLRTSNEANQYFSTLTNINTPTRLFRADNGSDIPTKFDNRWQAGGRWFNLVEGTKLYRSYDTDISSAEQGAGEWSDNNFPDYDTEVVGSTGILDVIMVEAAVHVPGDANKVGESTVTTDTDLGFIKVSDGQGDSRTMYDSDMIYSLKAYGYETIKVRPERANYGNAGRTVQLFKHEANITRSFGGGRSGGTEQTRVSQLWDGDTIRVSETDAATFNSDHLSSANYANSYDSDMTGITFNNTADTEVSITEFFAGLHYEVARPASKTEGNLHRTDGFTVNSDGVMVFNEDFTWTVSSTNNTKIGADADNASLTGFEMSGTGNQINLRMAGPGLSYKAPIFANLPTTVPNYTSLDGRFTHPSGDGDETYIFNASTDLSNFTFNNGNSSNTVTLVNGGGATTEGSGTTNIVNEAVITLDVGSTASASDLRSIRWTSSTTATPGTWNGNNSSVILDTDGNTLTITLYIPDGDTNIWFAFAYNGLDPIKYNGTDFNHSFTGTTNTVITGDTPVPDFTRTDFSPTSDVDLANTTVSAIADADTDIAVNIDETEGLSSSEFTFALTADWLRRYVIESNAYLEAMAQDFVSTSLISFGADTITFDVSDTATRFVFTHTASNNQFVPAARVVNRTPTDLWRSVTSTNNQTYIWFEPNKNGASGGEINTILDNRLVTANNMGNLGLGVPVKGTDDNLVTSPDV